MPSPPLVVLVRPTIPPNTGNIGRTCVGLGFPLWLVGELGFSLDDRQLRRAGLDYWSRLVWHHEPDEQRALANLASRAPVLFSKRGECLPWEIDLCRHRALVFGSELEGLPPIWLRQGWPVVRFPQGPGIRSYNLASVVHAAAMEWVRQNRWDPPALS